MKIKRFNESLDEGKPEVGDYVICVDLDQNIIKLKDEFDDYISNHIGEIIKIEDEKEQYPLHVRYEEFPKYLSVFTDSIDTVVFNELEIMHWSKDREVLEMILKTNKFNI